MAPIPAISLGVLGAVIAGPAEFAHIFVDFPRVDAAAECHRRGAVAGRRAGRTDPARHRPLAIAVHTRGRRLWTGRARRRPGPSGLGKTTLVAALVRAAFGYVSDEALAIDRSTGDATAFPRPLSVNADVWQLFANEAGEPPEAGHEGLIAPTALGRVDAAGGRVSDILLARRPAAPRLEQTRRGDAVTALLRHSFNHFVDAPASFRAAVALVRGARVWQACYTDAQILPRNWPPAGGVRRNPLGRPATRREVTGRQLWSRYDLAGRAFCYGFDEYCQCGYSGAQRGFGDRPMPEHVACDGARRRIRRSRRLQRLHRHHGRHRQVLSGRARRAD